MESLTRNRTDFLDAILEALPDAVAILDTEMSLVEINPAGIAMLGAGSLEEATSMIPLSRIAPKDVARFVERFQSALRSESRAGELTTISVNGFDGVARVWECRIVRLENFYREVVGAIVVARDITSAVSQRHALKEAESLLHAIISSVPVALIVIDEQGRITSFSEMAESMFGYRETDVIGRNVNMLMPEPYHSGHDGYLQRFLDTGEKRIIGIGRVVEAVRSDGSVFPIELSVGEADVEGHRAFTGFIRDLTKQVEAEAQLQQVQSELHHAARLNAVGTLASALAHELNQPLTAIANYISAGRDMIEGDPQNNREMLHVALEEAASEAVRAGQIVRRLRDFVARGELDTRVLPLANLINDAAVLGLVGARESGVSWSIDIEPGIGSVLADRVQIQQVVINIMRNAIEAMESSLIRELRITARAIDSKTVEVSVADSGPGIDPAVQEQLFKPFTSTKGRGMGMGLSICRSIVEAHGGSLLAEPGETGGTVFRFTLMRALQEDLVGG